MSQRSCSQSALGEAFPDQFTGSARLNWPYRCGYQKELWAHHVHILEMNGDSHRLKPTWLTAPDSAYDQRHPRRRASAGARSDPGQLHRPGAINTPIWGALPGLTDPSQVEQLLDHAQTIPRVGRPEDIAAMVLYLAGDESQCVTGTAMMVDGGLTVGPSLPAQSTAEPQSIPSGCVDPSLKR